MINDTEIKLLQHEILELKKWKNVVIFAHNYQRPEIQQIADIVGDSLFLAKQITKIDKSSRILYAAVRFMAETGALLNNNVKIYFPVEDALCPMAKFLSEDIIKSYKQKNPDVPIVLYINSTTVSKQYADVICTSSNALEICTKLIAETGAKKIALGPDKNLGSWIKKKLGIEMDIIPEQGHCYVHDNFTLEDIRKFREAHPQAKILIHPEAPIEVVSQADFVGSTAKMYNYVVEHPEEEIGLGTEIGLLDKLRLDNPKIKVFPLKSDAICYSMKKYTLESIKWGLEEIDKLIQPISIDPEVAKRAIIPIKKMFDLMKQK